MKRASICSKDKPFVSGTCMHKNQYQKYGYLIKIGEYVGFCVHRGIWFLCPPRNVCFYRGTTQASALSKWGMPYKACALSKQGMCLIKIRHALQGMCFIKVRHALWGMRDIKIRHPLQGMCLIKIRHTLQGMCRIKKTRHVVSLKYQLCFYVHFSFLVHMNTLFSNPRDKMTKTNHNYFWCYQSSTSTKTPSSTCLQIMLRAYRAYDSLRCNKE